MGLLTAVGTGLVAASNMQVGATWLPTDRVNLIGWWDFADTGTISHTGGAVDSVTDKSGNSRTLTATTTARPTTGTRTLNSKNVLDFNGTTNVLTSTSFAESWPYTVGIVVACDNGANSTREQFFNAVTIGYGVEKSNTNKWRLNCGGNLDSTTTLDATPTVVVAVNANTSSVINVDGTETTGSSGSGGIASGVYIGGRVGVSFWLNGYIAEAVLYSDNMNSGDRGTLRTYLTTKWGL